MTEKQIKFITQEVMIISTCVGGVILLLDQFTLSEWVGLILLLWSNNMLMYWQIEKEEEDE